MKDKLSALLDGDLDEQSMRHVFDSIRRDRSLRADWEAYCAIGDALRGHGECSRGLVARVMAEIDAEPTVLAPAVAPTRASLRRSLMPIAASLMGVAAVGWVAHTWYPRTDGVARVASATAAVRVADGAPMTGRTAAQTAIDRDREYVFAHQAMTGGGPLSGVVQHVRTVADVRQDAAR